MREVNPHENLHEDPPPEHHMKRGSATPGERAAPGMVDAGASQEGGGRGAGQGTCPEDLTKLEGWLGEMNLSEGMHEDIRRAL